MLKKRIITTLTLQDGILFRTRNFEPDYRYTHNFIDMWSVDEIIILDITRGSNFRDKNKISFFKTLEFISKNIVVPLTVGGGIQTNDDIKKLLDNGADKIVVNSAALKSPKIINSFSSKYGKQCIVVSIDAKKIDNDFIVFSDYGKNKTNYKLEEWIKIAQEEGAGEIFLQSIQFDGSLEGYDYEMVEKISRTINLPLIVSSGAGNWEHFEKLFKYNFVSAASTTNIYHFTESSIKSLKTFLAKKHLEVRL
tara:strand:- start:8205 stop:8957 length:753 start_codon:yes stop_codon:yes gene_type:complete